MVPALEPVMVPALLVLDPVMVPAEAVIERASVKALIAPKVLMRVILILLVDLKRLLGYRSGMGMS
jgi:hypothetical protein